MLVSVALPVYNGFPFLQEALATILKQDIEFEVIIYDDGSHDGSRQYVQALSDPRIRVLINEANAGIFGNLNRCIAAAKGRYIQVFSQDDLMKPGYLASQVDMLQKFPDAGLVYGTPDLMNEVGRLKAADSNDRTPEFIDQNLYIWIASHYGALPPSISSIMIPRCTFEAIGLFDAAYPVAGDIEFYNRVSERFPILRNLKVLHTIRTHRGMMTTQSSTGALYLQDEIALERWYRSRWNEGDYRKIRRFRAMTRGTYHAAWIAKKFRHGRTKEAMIALWRLNKLYPLHWIAGGLFLRFFLNCRPRPTLPAPKT